jgi:hypothetical protein
MIDFGNIEITCPIHFAVWKLSRGLFPFRSGTKKGNPCMILAIVRGSPFPEWMDAKTETSSIIFHDTCGLLRMAR